MTPLGKRNRKFTKEIKVLTGECRHKLRQILGGQRCAVMATIFDPISARIADELFDYLDAPVKRVAALDCFVGYAPDLEEATLPQIDDLLEAINKTTSY